MYETTEATTTAAIVGRRRLTVDAVGPAGGHNLSPTPNPIPEALDYGTDRLDRLDHMLDQLNDTIDRLTSRLEVVLRDGTPASYPEAPTSGHADNPTPEDRRSTVARRIAGLGLRVDSAGDRVGMTDRRLEALLDALEV